jgi:hypothetical protein
MINGIVVGFMGLIGAHSCTHECWTEQTNNGGAGSGPRLLDPAAFLVVFQRVEDLPPTIINEGRPLR